MKIFLGFRPGRFREPLLCKAFKNAMQEMGIDETKDILECDAAIWWGIPTSHKKYIQIMRERGKPFLITDFPYWNRTPKHMMKDGYYKISMNGINPTDYIKQAGFDADRYYKSGGFKIEPWKKSGQHVLICCMGPKSCDVFGYKHGWWDRKAAETVMQHSNRNIIFRQKPSDKTPNRIQGTIFDDGRRPLIERLRNCHAVITHHGGSTVEALALGIPGFTKEAVTRDMGLTDLKLIEHPYYPENREEFLYSVANWQWHYQEIVEGKPLKHLLKKGLLNG